MTATIPARKPARPFFSSGPCAKPPGYAPEKLDTQVLGRSHRAKIGKTRLQYCIDLMREVLQLPDTHRIGIVPGSDTGAFEMAMWTMLGARGVTALVASANERPSRSSGIHSASGTRTPEVVPFQVNSTSSDQSTLSRSGNWP